MKNLTDYINEKDSNDQVFVVKDVEGEFVGVFDTEEAAEAAKKEYEITPDLKAEISKAPRSEFMK